jgi:hypothetical protein
LVEIDAIAIDVVDIGDVSTMNTIGGTLVDSGTTLLYVSQSVYSSIKTAVQASVSSISNTFFQWSSCLTSDQISDLPTITFTIDDFELVLEPDEYLLFYESCYYWGLSSSTVPIIGNIALQDLFIVFDKESNQIGFADAVCSTSTTSSESVKKPKSDKQEQQPQSQSQPQQSQPQLTTQTTQSQTTQTTPEQTTQTTQTTPSQQTTQTTQTTSPQQTTQTTQSKTQSQTTQSQTTQTTPPQQTTQTTQTSPQQTTQTTQTTSPQQTTQTTQSKTQPQSTQSQTTQQKQPQTQSQQVQPQKLTQQANFQIIPANFPKFQTPLAVSIFGFGFVGTVVYVFAYYSSRYRYNQIPTDTMFP